MSEYLLEMKNITKIFPGVKALDNVQLNVRAGTVHALMGENGAGKSTLMKCLFGIYEPNSGEIFLDGQKAEIHSARQAMDKGIAMVHQELHPIRFRSVMENVYLGRFPGHLGVVDHKAMYDKTKALFEDLELDVDPLALAGEQSAAILQMMEIARAVDMKAKIIILDEPTSSLSDREVDHLFKIINRLRAQGVAFIYISHKMKEILEISDEVKIMRDGQYVGTWPVVNKETGEKLTNDFIIKQMVGREMTNQFPPREGRPSDEVVLKVEHVCSPLRKSFQDVSFELHKQEILGIGGLVGAQRTEFVEALFGLRSIQSGEIYLNGAKYTSKSPGFAKSRGLALLTEERRATGIFGILPILENTVIANQRKYASLGILNDHKRRVEADKECKKLNVKTPSLETLIQNLSGGNQQKVLIARWLLTNSDILILDEPTRGIDVGAKYEIYNIMLEQISQGRSIIMISSEMPELMGMSDRIMVMCEGRVTGFLNKGEYSQEKIMALATQFAGRKENNPAA
ncbi:MAG: sugar ABC transporter ATP-binding protein [Synergistaceae bacterium]|nr:sugar ABC transporter ATP-binding protein [Synergistaceae bacterium]